MLYALVSAFLTWEWSSSLSLVLLPPLQYSMQASFLEIYNETIRDLLASSTAKPCQHDIKLDPSVPGGVYVSNIEPIAVKSAAQVATLLDRAKKNRAVAATNCNERSSRSHSVFRLQLTGSNDITAEKCKGQFSGRRPPSNTFPSSTACLFLTILKL